MNFYVDYDDLLVHNTPLRGGRIGRKAVQVRLKDGSGFSCLLRPLANTIISKLQALGTIRILSSADKEYLLSSSEALGLSLPFPLICFDDYLKKTDSGYILLAKNVEPNGILIEHYLPFSSRVTQWDNIQKTNPALALKMDYLGITPQRVVLLEPYLGQMEGRKAEESLASALVQIASLKT